MSFWQNFKRDHIGWPDANNDEDAPMPGRDWAFTVVLLWAFVATITVFILAWWPR